MSDPQAPVVVWAPASADLEASSSHLVMGLVLLRQTGLPCMASLEAEAPHVPRPPNVPLIRVLWPLFGGT